MIELDEAPDSISLLDYVEQMIKFGAVFFIESP